MTFLRTVNLHFAPGAATDGDDRHQTLPRLIYFEEKNSKGHLTFDTTYVFLSIVLASVCVCVYMGSVTTLAAMFVCVC